MSPFGTITNVPTYQIESDSNSSSKCPPETLVSYKVLSNKETLTESGQGNSNRKISRPNSKDEQVKMKVFITTSIIALICFLIVEVEPRRIFPVQGKLVEVDDSTYIKAEDILKSIGSQPNGCSCANKMCSCCAHLSVPHVIDKTVCVNISYVSAALGFDVKVLIDGKIVYQTEISVRNPPPICFGIPYLKKLAKLCLKLYNISWRQHIGACIKIEVKLLWIIHEDFDLGCFNFNDLDEESKAAVSRMLFELERLQQLQNAGIQNLERDRPILL